MARAIHWTGVLLLDAALALAVLCVAGGLAGRLGVRPVSWGLVGAGALAALAATLPAPRREATDTRALDTVLPWWQFDEVHVRRMRVRPDAARRAIAEVTAREIRLFRLLTWLRRPRFGRCSESLLNAPADVPILAVAARSGFQWLTPRGGPEVVLGTVLRGGATTPAPDVDAFRALGGDGVVKAALSFVVQGVPDGTTEVRTETRVQAHGTAAVVRFAAYWRLIYPGSAFIRRQWLRAIERRALRATPLFPSAGAADPG